jgi:hypothetical protein
MTLVALVAVALAGVLAVLAWTQHREARQRSAARVAALAAALDGPVEAVIEERSVLSAAPAVRAWIMTAGAVPVALVIAALLVTRGPGPAPAPIVARQPDSLELLDMRPARNGDQLTVTGTVRVRGHHTAPVTAVITGRDAAGRIVSSAHAPLDDASLDVAGESSFQVFVPGGQDVRRYQVRFETPLGPLTHIDRRPMP